MKKIKIEIGATFATEWQEKIHMDNIKRFLDMMNDYMTNPLILSPQCKHKDNKFEYKIIELE